MLEELFTYLTKFNRLYITKNIVLRINLFLLIEGNQFYSRKSCYEQRRSIGQIIRIMYAVAQKLIYVDYF